MFNDEFDEYQDEPVSLLEGLVSEDLLLELIKKKKAEIYENVVFEGKRRYYIEDLTQRDYNLENTTPYQLSLSGRILVATSWGKLLCDMVNLLLESSSLEQEQLLSFRCDWTKSAIFSAVSKINHRQLNNGLYLNCNHTALHACWVLQDLLRFFGVDLDSVSFLIHRPCSAEPDNIKNYIEERFKKGMLEYLLSEEKLSEKEGTTIISVIERFLNPILASLSKSYTNFFLFDDAATLYNYGKRVKDRILNNPTIKPEAAKIFNLSLAYLIKYFKCSTY